MAGAVWGEKTRKIDSKNDREKENRGVPKK